MSDNEGNDFFIGWDPESGRRSQRHSLVMFSVLAVLILSLTAVSVIFQENIGSGTFDYGNIREFEGVFIARPVPMLITSQPVEGDTVFFLVNEWKYGVDPEVAAAHDMKAVKISGTLIRNGRQSMIEVAKNGIVTSNTKIASHEVLDRLNPSESTNRVELQGEIVDSKCWLGVMNPGIRKTHRACAMLCIKGGIPPILVGRRQSDSTDPSPQSEFFIGNPVNEQILDFVAFPVQLSGTLSRIAGRNFVYVDVESILIVK